MFFRKYWIPLSVFVAALAGLGLYLLSIQPPPEPIKIYTAVESLEKSTEEPTAEAPVVEQPKQGGIPMQMAHGTRGRLPLMLSPRRHKHQKPRWQQTKCLFHRMVSAHIPKIRRNGTNGGLFFGKGSAKTQIGN